MTVLLVVAGVAALAWLVLAVDRPRRWPAGWRLPTTAEITPEPESPASEVAVVVPARNEAESLPATLPRLLRQDGPVARIVVVDDRSEDDTARVARRIADGWGGGGPAIAVVRIDTLPDGWMGKVHAMTRGVASLDGRWTAAPRDRWILFTDADIEHPPDSVRRLLARARSGPFDLVSVMAHLPARSFWERILIPAFVWFFQAMYPFRRVSIPRSRVAAAAGGCVLVREEILRSADLPASIRSAVIDDVALARRAKDAGGRLWLGFDRDEPLRIASRRAYSALGSIVDMVARSAFAELRYRYAFVPLVWLGLLWLFVVPPAAAIAGAILAEPLLLALGLGTWVVLTLLVLPAFAHHEVPRYALLMPVAAVLYAWMTTVSAWRHATGRVKGWRTAAGT